ncbi:BTB/POZ domain-containing protein 16-like isoform X4 [Mizuhopecten yessoensis]|uniref:BTB/POZ domain-containing protein 16 n=1 Tax=Mizuhopecten yessoensis TaxID=6573 RepID=A0A210PUS9_MIZYE|nr:BTB/POZ domain-containing protein 16-like isoform X4 [Mizuhopecten yessoensis]OWF40204.1 BTB/POZ domain-containing protein 16 [Mizuhopecten yessoensis]
MADVSTMGSHPLKGRLSTSYFPNIPPSAPKATISYCKSVNNAPYTALMGVVVDARQPDRHPITPRCRMRKLVGSTNRWRLPESLGSDLLGSRQAIKSVAMPFNQSLINIITAESPQINMNLDTSMPYKFRQTMDRPYTQPMAESGPEAVTRSGSFMVPKPPQIPASAPSRMPAGPVSKYVPSNARPTTPKDIFLYHSKKNKNYVGPDVLLKCLGMDWELHRPYVQKSEVLAQLLREADDPRLQKYYRSPASETLDNYIKKSNFYSNEYREISNRLSMVDGEEKQEEEEAKGVDHPAHISQKRFNNVTIIKLDIRDPLVSKRAMAVALGNMYHDEQEVNREDVVGVLAASSYLGCKSLMDGCAQLMLKTISYRTVCQFHKAASKYQQEHVLLACERWMELNLIPQLSSQIQLREVPMEVLQKILKSNRLFVYNEYSVYKTLAYWLFLQLNQHIQLMPSHSTVLTFFNSLPKSASFLDNDDGQIYAPLFAAVRLHGIVDTNNIQDMQLMNVLPQSTLIDLLSQHYHALQGGGDMAALRHFTTGAIRQGFVVDDEPHYHSEVFSLHGFHFELKAVRNNKDQIAVFMQRLRPGDPILSFRQCERHTFSMRADREVRYCITVQQIDSGDHNMKTTGVVTQKFGLGEKTSRSEVIKLEKLDKPAYVVFSIFFPAS